MNPLQRQFLDRATAEATKASHPFPRMAACEAALESGWGNSALARNGNNLFGMKQHQHPSPACGVMSLPTREFLNSEWVTCQAEWVKYSRLGRVLRRPAGHAEAALDALRPLRGGAPGGRSADLHHGSFQDLEHRSRPRRQGALDLSRLRRNPANGFAMNDLNLIERIILRREAMNFLKKYWPTIAAALGAAVPFLMPSLLSYVQLHPHTAVGVLLAAVIAAYHATAPKDKEAS